MEGKKMFGKKKTTKKTGKKNKKTNQEIAAVSRYVNSKLGRLSMEGLEAIGRELGSKNLNTSKRAANKIKEITGTFIQTIRWLEENGYPQRANRVREKFELCCTLIGIKFEGAKSNRIIIDPNKFKRKGKP
ncbi:hypothetical protein KKE06_04960 [Candidatus Micrarchaeota archaeon]|nr:hypothetical protein [Candidatus Micrarchaeota archaeon]MBU1930252.1 hypothetical protein [Candidatus Micrarchaeota archaeon]